jgi:hypothetical protein
MSSILQDYNSWAEGDIKMYSTSEYLNKVLKDNYIADDLKLVDSQIDEFLKQKKELKEFRDYKEAVNNQKISEKKVGSRIPESFFEYIKG